MKRFAGLFAIFAVFGLTYFFTYEKSKKNEFSKYKTQITKESNTTKSEKNNAVVDTSKETKGERQIASKRNTTPVDTRVKRPSQLKKSTLKINQNNIEINIEPSAGEFNFGDKKYQRVSNLAAISKRSFSQAPYNVLSSVNGFYIIEVQDKFDDLSDVSALVYNSESKNYAIFTGVIKVKFKDFGYSSINNFRNLIFDRSGADFDFVINNVYENINVAHYKFNSYESAVSAHKLLSSGAYNDVILRARVELLEYFRVN